MLSSVTLYCLVTMIFMIEFLNFQKRLQFHMASQVYLMAMVMVMVMVMYVCMCHCQK